VIGKNTRAYEGNEESAEPEGMARKEYEQKCTHPELRKELLEAQASTKGGGAPARRNPSLRSTRRGAAARARKTRARRS
jgi:hypothetical protein